MKTRHLFPRHIASLALLALVVMAASPVVSAAPAGKVVFSSGSVQLERGGKKTPLAKGGAIESGDTIVTGQDGRVQLLMADGDRMAIRTNTRFRIDEFRAPASVQQPETGRSFYTLIKGGFRAVTRSLGKRGQDSYQVKTPVATLGIRGTTYWVRYWPGDVNNPEGYYFGVSDGGINVGNGAGQMAFMAGQYGYVKDLNSPPQLLPGPPSFLTGEGGNGNGGTEDNGYSGGSPVHGCTNAMSGDVNCPPIQPIEGDGFDLTPGNSPSSPPPVIRDDPQGPPTEEPPIIRDEIRVQPEDGPNNAH